jgi:polar amino acid transport system substrate-binding protein
MCARAVWRRTAEAATMRQIMMRTRAAALIVVMVATACTASAPTTPTAKPSASPASVDPLTAVRARGSLIVAIRVSAPATGVQQQDVAHAQKRALEAALASALTKRIIGANARVDFKELGRDRAGLVERGEADLAMTFADTSGNVAFSQPYAAGGVVLVVKGSSTATEPRALAGQIIAATTMGEINANEVAQVYFRDKGITATLSPVPGLSAAFAALDAGQVAAVIGDRTGIALLQRSRTEPVRVIAEVASRPYVIATRKDATSLRAAVDSALADLAASGEVRKLADAAGFPYESP